MLYFSTNVENFQICQSYVLISTNIGFRPDDTPSAELEGASGASRASGKKNINWSPSLVKLRACVSGSYIDVRCLMNDMECYGGADSCRNRK